MLMKDAQTDEADEKRIPSNLLVIWRMCGFATRTIQGEEVFA